ncbi:MAG: 16S rRNA (cytosine(967)-C(5))-methyltransferase, partial [Tatlockia sp.]|nr:16S rRNA (cytosine(967)-C(5))-methyltransferase [Tatlockia sp.]
MPASKDLTPFTKEICFGVCRHYYRLEALANSLMKKRPKELEVWLIVIMGLYQLHFMKKPDYAVVKETVALLDPLKKTWAKGLVNAVLRGFCREQATHLARVEKTDDFIYGHPSWFIKRLQSDWPLDWQTILMANDSHPPMSLRVNRRQMQRENYLQRLEQAGIKAIVHPFSADGLRLLQPCSVHELPGFTKGDISVQD